MTMLTLLKLISAAHRVTLFGRLGILLLVLWHIDDPEPGPTLMLICNDFSVAVSVLDLAPKSRYLTPCFGRMFGDIVQCNDSTASHQWPVHFKITSNTIISVVAINEQIVERLSPEDSFDPREHFGPVRISLQ